MKVEFRREAPSRAVLEVELPPETVSQGMERALAQLNRRVEIRGFRRGKAPKTLLERYVGKEAIHEEAVKLLVPDAYSQAIRESGVHPIAQPEIQVQSFEEGKPLRFVATVDLVPDVRLGDYKAIRVDRSAVVVTDADIDAAIEDLRARHAHLESLGDQAAASGDYVLVRITEVSGSVDRFLAGKEYLVDHEGQHLVADLAESLSRRGITMDRYLQVQEKTEDQLRTELRPAAEKRLRTQLALDELARLEGLQPSQEEMDREVENVARGLQQDLPRVREWLAQNGRLDVVRGTLRRRKALSYLQQSARHDPVETSGGRAERSREGEQG